MSWGWVWPANSSCVQHVCEQCAVDRILRQVSFSASLIFWQQYEFHKSFQVHRRVLTPVMVIKKSYDGGFLIVCLPFVLWTILNFVWLLLEKAMHI